MEKVKTVGGYYVNEERTAIVSLYRELEVVDGKIPDSFIVSPNVDNEMLRISANGKRIEVVERPQPNAEEQAAFALERSRQGVRRRRNALIAQTDYLLMPDYPIAVDELAAVKAYRQALRDITLQPSFAETGEVEWPEKPE